MRNGKRKGSSGWRNEDVSWNPQRKIKKFYHYCSVVFGDDFHPYHYRMEDTSLKIGDKVLVPAGKENEECIATVVSVEEHTRLTVPFPLNKTKFIIAKYTEEEK